MRERAVATTILLGVSATLLTPSVTRAQWGGEIRGQMGFGGDEIATVQYSDGSASDLRLGTYFTATLGPVLEVWTSGPNALELQAMVGWAGWSTGPENTDDRLSLHRVPLEALVFYGYRFPDRDMSLRVGGGVSYHLFSDLSGSGSLDDISVAVDNAAGPVAEASIIFGILAAGLRYTHMNNTVEGEPSSLSGASAGLFMSLTSPRN